MKRRINFNKIVYKSFGKKSIIYNPMCVCGKKYIEIGSNVTIRDYVRIEAIDKYMDQKFCPCIKIGDNTSFEQGGHIISNDKLIIGNNCVFSARVFISTANHSYEEIGINVLKQKLLNSKVVIGDNCFVGIDVKIFPGVKIGNNVIIGAGSIVKNDLPDYTVCAGVPAKVIKKYDFKEKKWIKV